MNYTAIENDLFLGIFQPKCLTVPKIIKVVTEINGFNKLTKMCT